MTREEAIERLKNYTQYRCGGVDLVALNMAIQALEQEPCNDTVSREVFKQVMWERDTAIEQLRELGYGLGQKIEPCDDAISRTDMLDAIGHGTTYTSEDLQRIIKGLPSVLPKREENTVSEEVYTEEYMQRKKLECELYLLKRKISELI